MSDKNLSIVDFFSANPTRLSEFLKHLDAAVFAVDSDQNIVFWNQAAEKLTGFSESEVLGRHCLAGIRCDSCLESCSAISSGVPSEGPAKLVAKDGRSLVVRRESFPLRDPDGRLLGAVEILHDQTSLVAQMETCCAQREEIRNRERLQAAVLGSIREGVITIDRDFRISSFSRRAEAISGIRADKVLGRFCHEVIGSHLCREDCPARHCQATGEPEAARATEIALPDGVLLPVEEIAVPLTDENGQPLGTVLLLEDRRLLAGDAASEGAVFEGMVGRSEAMQRLFRMIEQVGPTDVTVLITGESGTGKEMAARAIHERSPRRNRPFVAVNAAALPESLLESELFGHVRGAFTGAVRDRAGRIEEAEGGTLFLDEIGELAPALQAKLLRFLQEREYQRVGESRTRTADVRILAATNRDLSREVTEGRFREDLYYRIRVIPIEIGPLRERPEDIPLLASHLLEKIAKARKKPGMTLSPQAMQRLVRHSWPGNVRELVNALEYAVAMCPSRRIRPEDLPPETVSSRSRYRARADRSRPEEERIREALERFGGNRTRAAAFLGMDRVTLYRKMKNLKIDAGRQREL